MHLRGLLRDRRALPRHQCLALRESALVSQPWADQAPPLGAVRLQGMEALLSVSVDPAPPVLVITGLPTLSALILMYAGFRFRRAEIHYSE